MDSQEVAQKVVLYAETIIDDVGEDAAMLAFCIMCYALEATHKAITAGTLDKMVKSFPGVESVKASAKA